MGQDSMAQSGGRSSAEAAPIPSVEGIDLDAELHGQPDEAIPIPSVEGLEAEPGFGIAHRPGEAAPIPNLEGLEAEPGFGIAHRPDEGGPILDVEGIDIPSAVFDDRSAFVEAARRGVPGAVVRQAVKMLGHRELFARLLGTTPGNLNRFYQRKSLAPAQSEALLDLLRVFIQAASVFGGRDSGSEWLVTQVPALGGQRPVDLCDTFEGRTLVREALRKIEYGEFP